MDISLEKLEAAITPFQCGKKGFVAVKPFDLSKRRNDVQDHVSKRIPPRTGCFACIHFLSANDIVHFETMALMRATIGEAIGLTGGTDEIDLLRRKIDGLNRKMVSLINESVESGEGIESHEAEFKELSDTIELLQGRIQKLEEALASDQVNDSRILQLQQIIADRASKKMEYDDTIVHQMIECVKVYPDGRLDIIFGGGYLIEERLEKEN